ncbi:DUF4189 domain-containing protein [Lysobacter tyrosinilyticus]
MQPNRPICVPIPGAGSGDVQQSAPQPHSEARWGAIATDSINGTAGYATNQASKGAAESSALTDCGRGTGSACKVIIAYENQCAVLVVSSNSHLVQSGSTAAEATVKAMNECKSAGVECSVYYSACSFPQRVY